MLASCLEYCRRNIQSKTISRLFLSKPNSLLTNTGLAFWWHVHLHSVCLLLINCLFTSNFSVIVDLFKEKLLPKFDNFGQFWWVGGGGGNVFDVVDAAERGRRQRERKKKTKWFIKQKHKFARYTTFILYIFLPSLHDHKVKMPNSVSWRT